MSYPTVPSTIRDPDWKWDGDSADYRDFRDTFLSRCNTAKCSMILEQGYTPVTPPPGHPTYAVMATYRKKRIVLCITCITRSLD